MPLSDFRRSQLDGIILKMSEQNASQEDVQSVVNDFKSKYDNEVSSQVGQQDSWWNSALKTAGNLAVGAVKGAGSTILGIGELGTKTLGRLVGADVAGTTRFAEQQRQTTLKPVGTAQKVGFGAEQIGEFLLPTGIETKIASKLGTLGKVGAAAAKIGVASTEAGLKTLAQTGGDTKKAVDATLWTALLGGAGKAAEAGKNIIGEQMASRVVNSLIKPGKSQFAYGKDPGQAIADAKIVAKDFDELLSKIGEEKQKIGGQIEAVLQNKKSAQLDLSDTLKPLNDALEVAKKAPRTNAAQISRIEALKSDLLKESVDKSGNVVFGRSLGKMSILDANEFKKDIGELTKYTGNPSDDKLINGALQQVYRNAKVKIEGVAPEIKPLNEKYGNFLAADVAVKNRAAIVERQNLVSLPSLTGGVGAGTIGAILTGSAPAAVLAGMGSVTLQNMLGSVQGKTAIASWLSKTTPSQLLELYRIAPRVFQIIVDTGNETSQNSQ